MKNSYKLGLIVMGLIAGIGSAHAQSKGDWVLAKYKGGGYWYPGVIQAVSGETITVAYDDGDRETLSVSAVRPYNWAIGGRVECNFKGAGKWYPGKIASLGGETIGINYDDGDRETTKTGRCRSQ
jgi:Agenet domain